MSRDCGKTIAPKTGKDDWRPYALQQRVKGAWFKCVGAQNTVPAQLPEVARSADRWLIGDFRQLIGGIGPIPSRDRQPLDPQIDLAHRETGGFEVEIELHRR